MRRHIVPPNEAVEPHHIADWAVSADCDLYEGGVDEDLILNEREYITPLMTAVLKPDCARRSEILAILNSIFYREFLASAVDLDPRVEKAIESGSIAEFKEIRDWADCQRTRMNMKRAGNILPADLNAIKEQFGWKWLP